MVGVATTYTIGSFRQTKGRCASFQYSCSKHPSHQLDNWWLFRTKNTIMNKTKTILAATLFGAAIMTSASAQSEKSGEAPTGFLTVNGGYFIGEDQAYLYSSYVTAVDESAFFGVELMTFSDSESGSVGALDYKLDARAVTFGAVYQIVSEVSENDFINYSFGGGIAYYDLDARETTSGDSASDYAFGYYLGATMGYERRLSDSVSFNTNLRVLHLGDTELRASDVDLDFESFYIGLEAGLVFKF